MDDVKFEDLRVLITKAKRTWCDVTVYGRKTLATRVRKEAVEGLPVGEMVTVSGYVKWESNRFGSTSELVIIDEDTKREARKKKAEEGRSDSHQ